MNLLPHTSKLNTDPLPELTVMNEISRPLVLQLNARSSLSCSGSEVTRAGTVAGNQARIYIVQSGRVSLANTGEWAGSPSGGSSPSSSPGAVLTRSKTSNSGKTVAFSFSMYHSVELESLEHECRFTNILYCVKIEVLSSSL